jgi:hypothetical protein
MKSKHIIKNHVRFKGEFKKEFKDEFPGRDLAEFIAKQLRQKKCVVNSVEYADPWFTVNVVSGSIEYPLMVSHSAFEEDFWEISCPRTLGRLAVYRGKSEDTEMQNLVNALDEILQDKETITDIKWFSDYSDLTDDYIKKPVAKRLSVVGKYLKKLAPPLCITGWVLVLIGGISGGKESLLLRIGAIMFMLPIVTFFGLIVINLVVALISDVHESFQKKKKKRWGRWLFAVFIISLFVVPFILGYFDIPSERIAPSIEKFVFGFLVLLLLCGMLFGLSCGALCELQKLKEKKKKIFLIIGSVLILFGILGFFGGALSSLGVLKWVSNSFEFPLAHISDMELNKDGDLFVIAGFYGRVQKYDQNGDFVLGWFIGTGGVHANMEINDKDQIEVATLPKDKIDVFDKNGKLLRTKKQEDLYSLYPSGDKVKHLVNESASVQYDVTGFAFPEIIQTSPNGIKKIGKNAFYLFPFQGAWQGWSMAAIGMVIMIKSKLKE